MEDGRWKIKKKKPICIIITMMLIITFMGCEAYPQKCNDQDVIEAVIKYENHVMDAMQHSFGFSENAFFFILHDAYTINKNLNGKLVCGGKLEMYSPDEPVDSNFTTITYTVERLGEGRQLKVLIVEQK